jgi:predicted metalloprotease
MAQPRPARAGRGLRVLALVCALAVGAACAIGSTGDDGGSGSGSGGGQGQPQACQTNANEDQEDGTMTANEFRCDLEGAVNLAESYWGDQFRKSGERFQPIRRIVPYERAGEIACGGEALPKDNAAYCEDGDFIAYDVNFAVAAFQKVGDAFLFYLLGHEYAHGIQARLGIQHRLTIDHELQADCMAGAYIGDSVDNQSLKLDKGDLDEFQTGLRAVGDDPSVPWFAPGAHGTAEQRTESFLLGLKKSLPACGLT